MLEILKKKRQEGFTLVELLIVIVIIAILAALVIVTFSGVQARARNTERQTDISAIAKYLEIYYANESRYLTALQMTNSTPSNVVNAFNGGNARGLDVSALQAPGGNPNSFVNALSASDPKVYGYQTVPAACDNGNAGNCASYTLSWVEEAYGTVAQAAKTKASANN